MTKTKYDGQLFGSKNGNESKRCCAKRYIIAVLGLLGFANMYALRSNLSVALVAMTSNITVLKDGKLVEVSVQLIVQLVDSPLTPTLTPNLLTLLLTLLTLLTLLLLLLLLEIRYSQ